MDRKDFYFRQRVTQSEIDAAFNSSEVAQRDIVKDILGGGFLVGGSNPATVIENTTPDLQVIINQFLGYDQLGQRLSNSRSGYQAGVALAAAGGPQLVDISVDEAAASTAVSTPGNEKTVSIFVEFRRNPSDPRTDGNGATVNWLQDESVTFNIVQSAEAGSGLSVPPPLRNDQLLLADIVLTHSKTTILNADIDQSRREGFALALIHGNSHTESGTDPIPVAVATSGQGGLMSGNDKIKLDAVDFTDSGVGALFQKFYAVFQTTNITAPAATTLNVTPQLTGKSAGGSTSVEGVLTQSAAPKNRVTLQTTGGDDLLDSSTGNKVYGRLTVDSEVTPTLWTLSFYTLSDVGVENAFDMTPFSGDTLQMFCVESYSFENIPSDGFLRIPSDQVAAEVPDATETVKGIVELSANLEEAANVAVQGDDDRLHRQVFLDVTLTGTVTPSGLTKDRIIPGAVNDISDASDFDLSTVFTDGKITFNRKGKYQIIGALKCANEFGSVGDIQVELIQPAGAPDVDIPGIGTVSTGAEVGTRALLAGTTERKHYPFVGTFEIVADGDDADIVYQINNANVTVNFGTILDSRIVIRMIRKD